MLIRIGDTTREAMDVLGIKGYPFTSKDLTTCFRSMAKANHPDNGGTHERMIATINAYKTLKHLAVDTIEVEDPTLGEMEVNDMFTFYEYKVCQRCDGTGRVYTYIRGGKCPKCGGSGNRVVARCKFCNDGIFTLRSGRTVPCRACKGTGEFILICTLCRGDGYVKAIHKEVNCQSCGGSGKIKKKIDPFNPVIPKGAIL